MVQEQLAIIGIGCRFPGGACDAASFWELLRTGTDAIVDVPEDRWDVRRFHDPDPRAPGKTYTRQAGFLRESIWRFDAQFFGISPREAEIMDPQQRLLLEVSWEALEDAGVPVDGGYAARTGVYVGAFCFDNALQQMGVLSRDAIGSHTATSASMVMLSNRISYALDLKGPSLTVDTACSSSLVAVHLACRALWDGECDAALAGGVNVMLRPESTILECKGGFLSPDARCKTFDERANGYVRGEGAGMIVLKRLSAAQADGDRIYALICATGVNQDGRTPGITLPNRDSQERLIREVCGQAGISPRRLQYVEAHGTGTQAGDPAEASALGAVLAAGRAPGEAVWVGSVKTNLGHLEAGAGVAGVIKTALVLQHGEVPPNLHFQRPNPRIDFDSLRLRVPTRLERLPEGEEPYAAVNSFGYGGTNAHAILRRAPRPAAPRHAGELRGAPLLFPLSARDPNALRELAARTAAMLERAQPGLADACHAAAVRRTHHAHRLAVIARSSAELARKLRAFSRDEPLKGVISNQAGGEPRGVVFVYTGMGAQWWGMGETLFAREPEFHRAVEECGELFAGMGAPSFIRGGATGEAMAEPQLAQPANFTLQVALTRLWRARGVVPAAIVGHSVGEIAAAWAAGALELRDAVRITYHRSRLQQRLAGRGAMLAVALSASDCRGYLEGQGDRIGIAALNSPTSVTLSGETAALRELAARLEERGIYQRFLKVEVAYHSAQMASLEGDFRAALADLGSGPPRVPLYSTVRGRRVGPGEHGAGYWWRNAREPVLFAEAIQALLADGFGAFLEIGPHAVLSSAIAENARAAGRTALVASSLRRGADEEEALLEGLAALSTGGCRVDWRRLYPAGEHVPLPSYPWQRVELWSEAPASREDRLVAEPHPLLHQRVQSPQAAWETEASFQFFPYLRDHRVAGAVVYPGAAYVASALAAGQLAGRGQTLEDVELHRALLLGGGAATLRLALDERDGRFTIHSRGRTEGAGWVLHCSGHVLSSSLELRSGRVDLAAVRARSRTEVSTADLYRSLSARGLEYGPAFRGVQRLWRGDREVLAELACGDPAEAKAYGIHPTVLDAAFQSLLAAVPGEEAASGAAMVPVRIRQVRRSPDAGPPAWAHGRIRALERRALEGDLALYDAEGNPALEVIGLRCQAVASESAADPASGWKYLYRWEPSAPPAIAPVPAGTWLLLARRGAASGLVEALRERGQRCLLASPGEAFSRDGDRFTVDPREASDLRRLVEAAGPALGGVAYLWGLGAEGAGAQDGASATGMEDGIAVLHLVQALAACGPAGLRRLALVTAGAHAATGEERVLRPGQGTLWGLGRVISSEHPELGCTRIDLDPGELPPPWRALAAELLAEGAEDEIALRGGRRLLHRLDRASPDDVPPAEVTADTAYVLENRTPGLLDGLTYHRTERRKPGRGEVELEVRAASLNFKDLMKAMHLLSSDYLRSTFIGDSLGMECAGVVVDVGEGVAGYRPGDAVVAIDSHGAFRSFHTVSTGYMAHKPGPLSFEEAPCLINFVTPYHGLRHLARVEPGEKVLIHSATGGVGLAAIQVARWLGAEIFATTGTEEKRRYLRSMGIEHVFDSRSLRFADEILDRTGGRGVDVVLNSLPGDGMRKSFELLAPYGRFIEIGKKDIMAGTGLGLAGFDRNLAFAALDTDRMGAERPALFRRLIDEVCQLLEAGTLRALPVTAFPARHAADAFRQMAGARHIGKLVVRMREGKVPVRARPGCAPGLLADRTYLVTGGLGGFGLEVARWLVERGARNLVLAGRGGAGSPEALAAVRALLAQGARVHAARVDVAETEQVRALFGEMKRDLPPLAGVIHAAMVLDDAALAQLDRGRFEKVMRPKAAGAWNLHLATRDLPLDFFVLFSSASALIGNPGQGSYVAANAFLDALAEHRRRQGLPALSVAWGPVREVGILARHPEVERHLAGMGISGLTAAESLRILGELLGGGPAQLGVVDIDWQRWSASQPAAARLPRYQKLAAAQAAGQGDGGGQRLRAALLAAPADQRRNVLQDALCERLSRVMHLPVSRIDPQLSLDNMGVDSLMGVELAAALKLELGIELSPMALMQGQTVAQLAATLLEEILPEAAAPSPPGAEVAEVNRMSERELDALLRELLPAAPQAP